MQILNEADDRDGHSIKFEDQGQGNQTSTEWGLMRGLFMLQQLTKDDHPGVRYSFSSHCICCHKMDKVDHISEDMFKAWLQSTWTHCWLHVLLWFNAIASWTTSSLVLDRSAALDCLTIIATTNPPARDFLVCSAWTPSAVRDLLVPPTVWK